MQQRSMQCDDDRRRDKLTLLSSSSKLLVTCFRLPDFGVPTDAGLVANPIRSIGVGNL